MIEREHADIEIFLGSEVIDTVLITASSRRVRKLMESDYIELAFKRDEPMEYPLGCYAYDEIFGKFYITEEQAPTFNKSLHGYDYKLKFDAHYYRWQKHFVCMMHTLGESEIRSEKVWTLTSSLRNQMREFMINLQTLGYVDSSYNFRANDIALNTFVVIDESVETQMQSLTMSYSSTYMLDALKTMADTWGCEYWIEGDETNFKIHFGTCEYGTTEQTISLDSFTEDGEEVPATAETMSFDKDMSDGSANLLYYFGGTQNIPNTYRKELRLKACDIVSDAGFITRMNGYRVFNGVVERIDLYDYIVKEAQQGSNIFSISLGSQFTPTTYLLTTDTSIADESRIYTEFRDRYTAYADYFLRRLIGVRISAACRFIDTDGKERVKKIVTNEDAHYVSTKTILDERVVADLVIADFDTENNLWKEIEYSPLPLTHREWYAISTKISSILNLAGQQSGYDSSRPFNCSLWHWRSTHTYFTLPNNAYRSVYIVATGEEPYLDDYANRCWFVSDYFKYDGNMWFAFKDILGRRSGQFDPNKQPKISLYIEASVWVTGVTPRRSEIQYNINPDDNWIDSYLNPNVAVSGRSVTFAIISNQSLIMLEWEKVFSRINSVYQSGNSYYLSLFDNEDVILTHVDQYYYGDNRVADAWVCEVSWDASRYSHLREITVSGVTTYAIVKELCGKFYSAALSDSVWAIQTDSAEHTIYSNEEFDYEKQSIAVTDITTGGGETDTRKNLYNHNRMTSSNGTLGFSPDVMENVRGTAGVSIPQQTLEAKVDVTWNNRGDVDEVSMQLEFYIAFGAASKVNGQYTYDELTQSRPTAGDSIAYQFASVEREFDDMGNANDSSCYFDIPIEETEFSLVDESLWNRANRTDSGLLPYILVVARVGYKKNGSTVYPTGRSIVVTMTQEEDVDKLNFQITDHKTNGYYGFIDTPVPNPQTQANEYELGIGYINNDSSRGPRSQILNIQEAAIPTTMLTEGMEFVLYTVNDYKIPYKWFTDIYDNPSSLLTIGDRHLQLPIPDTSKRDIFNTYGMVAEYIRGKLYITKTYDDGYKVAYTDGCVFAYDMLVNSSKYFPSEKCVINENIYPMALCLIMRQNSTYDPNSNPVIYPKGIFKEDKVEYIEVEGESAANRLSYPWQQFHINIGTPTKDGTTTQIVELPFSKDYILKNGQPLKIRFLAPEDVKDLVGTTDFNVIKNNCKLAGMRFEAAFNKDISYKHSGEADPTAHTLDYAIARNEDFGAKLPSDILCPSNLDPCVLENWNVKTLSAMGLIDKAEYRLLDKAFEYYKAMHDNNFTITAEMMSDWMFTIEGRYQRLVEADDKYLIEALNKYLLVRKGLDTYVIPDIGMKVCVKHASLKNGEKHTRVLGYEMKLDKPYDTPKLIMGESEATSRLKVLEKELTKLS